MSAALDFDLDYLPRLPRRKDFYIGLAGAGFIVRDCHLVAYAEAGFRVVGHLMFPKRYTSSSRFLQYRHESAHLLAKGEPRAPENPISDIIDWKYTGNKLHPTQKPLAALCPLIESFSKPGDTVLDPFAGSGSSLLAAKKLGRNYVGVEVDGVARIGHDPLASGLRADVLAGLGVEHERVLADLDDVAVLQRVAGDAAVVDESTVRAVEVLEDKAPVHEGCAGVMARDRRAVDDDGVVGQPSDRHDRSQRAALQLSIVKTQDEPRQ